LKKATKRMPQNVLYMTVYKGLIAGQPLTKLARSIGYDKGYISRIKDDLLQAGFLVIINPRSRCKFYSATKKIPTEETVNKNPKLTEGARQQTSPRLNVVKIQKATFITDIKRPPELNIKWDNKYQLSPYTSVYDYVYPIANVGEVRFRRLQGTNSDRLLIFTPPMHWERGAGDPKDFLEEIARYAAGWIQKQFKMELSNLRICQKPDYCLTLTDPVLINAAQTGSYDINGLMLNSSAPDMIPEIESKDWETLSDLSKAPEDIRMLKFDVHTLKVEFSELKGMLKVLIAQNQELTNQNKEIIGLMRETFGVTMKPDEFMGVT